jgi:1,4-dihydroxy-2-naphthoate octaprenyltransferase
VLGGAAGPGLIPVLQGTGLAELSWALGAAAGLLLAS